MSGFSNITRLIENLYDRVKEKFFFAKEDFARPPEKKFVTNKSGVLQIEETWSTDLLDLNDDVQKKQGRLQRYFGINWWTL